MRPLVGWHVMDIKNSKVAEVVTHVITSWRMLTPRLPYSFIFLHFVASDVLGHSTCSQLPWIDEWQAVGDAVSSFTSACQLLVFEIPDIERGPSFETLRSQEEGCGWCPSSSICVPADSLLDPLSKKNICPLVDERYELRTGALGCGCSTTTLLSIVVTIFATIAGLILLYGLGLAIKYLNQHYGTGLWQGWEVDFRDGTTRNEHEWRRRGAWRTQTATFFRQLGWQQDRSEQEQVTERSRLLD
nr:hypothetical protein CFP56_29852 [Quercus suber]